MRGGITVIGSIWLALAIVSGCSLGKTNFSEGFRCDGQTDTCPDGQACIDGFCGTKEIDAGTDDAGPPAVQCGVPSQLVDGFDDPLWYLFTLTNPAGTGGSFAAENGNLVVTVPAVADAVVGAVDRFHVRLDEGRVFVQVHQPIGGVLPGFQVFDFGGTAELRREGSELVGYLRDINNDVVQRTPVPYSAAAHQWWGFREEGDTLFWEFSNNGTDWVVLMEAPREFWLDTTHIQLRGYSGAEATGGSAIFDNLNGGGRQEAAGCDVSLAQEDFENGLLATVVEKFENMCSATVLGGEFRMAPAVGVDSALCSIASVYRLDMREGGVSFKLVDAPLGDDAFLLKLEVEAVGGRSSITLLSNTLFADDCPNNECETLSMRPFNATDDLFWRIRDDNAVLTFETSADGLTWSVLATRPNAYDISFAGFTLIAFANGSPTTNFVTVDDINILPPP